jgi:hypothetical protein
MHVIKYIQKQVEISYMFQHRGAIIRELPKHVAVLYLLLNVFY